MDNSRRRRSNAAGAAVVVDKWCRMSEWMVVLQLVHLVSDFSPFQWLPSCCRCFDWLSPPRLLTCFSWPIYLSLALWMAVHAREDLQAKLVVSFYQHIHTYDNNIAIRIECHDGQLLGIPIELFYFTSFVSICLTRKNIKKYARIRWERQLVY